MSNSAQNPPHPAVSPRVPLPGSAAYPTFLHTVFKQTLSRLPEPTLDSRDAVVPQENLQLWRQEVSRGEELIKTLGPRVAPAVIYRTAQLKFMMVWAFWRSFRFHDLPPEIISSIFRIVAWSSAAPAEGVKQRLWLTWVCRSWRSYALSDPTLWNVIWFRDPPPYSRSLEWFNRAGSARIDIRINERDTHRGQNDKFTAEQMSDLLDKLFVKLPQIRVFVAVVDNWPPAITVLRKLQAAGNAGRSINIKQLEIYRTRRPYLWLGPGFDNEGHRDPPVLSGGRTEKLRHLCLSGVHIDWADTPFRNLTVLDLRNMPMNVAPTLQRFREVLRECPRLHKLILDGAGPQPIEKPFDHTPVDLPYLRTLVLGSFSVHYACFAVSQIDAAHLVDLTLLSLTGDDYTPLIKLLAPKFKKVRLLTLYGVQVEMTSQGKTAMVRWFESMPDLEYARIAQLRTSILMMLLEDPNEYHRAGASATYVLCPKLRTLEVQEMPYEVIVDFCGKRKEMHLPITKIYLNAPWAHKLTEQATRALNSVSDVYIAPPGSSTPEEDSISGR